MSNILGVNPAEISFNAKLKLYPDKMQAVIASKAIFRYPGWEDSGEKEFTPKPKNPDNDMRSDSVRRSRQIVRDIARLNSFDYFVTWTLDGSKINRENPQDIKKYLRNYLNNMQKRKGGQYLLIPEYHSDGKGIHMHGLMNGNFCLSDSGKKTHDGKTIYNMLDWSMGFSTCVKLNGDISKTANYIAKYITKDTIKIFGKLYYSSKGLIREPPYQLFNAEYCGFDAKEYSIPAANLGFKYVNIEEEI